MYPPSNAGIGSKLIKPKLIDNTESIKKELGDIDTQLKEAIDNLEK